jgi:hypothetical protein
VRWPMAVDPRVVLLLGCCSLAGRGGDPKPPRLLVAHIVAPYNGSDWLVSLVQAMVCLPPLVSVIRDAAIGDSPYAGRRAFVGLARRVQTTVLGALP